MSFSALDYLPFDDKTYRSELLPLWENALAGKVQPLRRYIQSAQYFSVWPHIHCPLTCPKEKVDHLFNRSLEHLRNEIRASRETDVSFWKLLSPILDAMESSSKPAHIPGLDLLHSCLLYTFCCDLPESEKESWQQDLGCILLIEEGHHLWLEYSERDPESHMLWEPFNQPLPPELIGPPLSSHGYPPTWATDDPRDVFQYFLRVEPSGFLSREQTVQLFKHYHRRQDPVLASIRSSCLRDAASQELPLDLSHTDLVQEANPGIWDIFLYHDLYLKHDHATAEYLAQQVFEALYKKHSQNMLTYQQRYQHFLWQSEEIIMRRVELATDRGWGMIEIARGKFGE